MGAALHNHVPRLASSMAEAIDILFINPGEPKLIYQGLADEFSAVEPPAFAGLYANYARRKGASVLIIDGPGEGLSSLQVAERATADLAPMLIVIPVYGFQPSASTMAQSIQADSMRSPFAFSRV